MVVLTLAHHPHGRSLDLLAYEVSVQGLGYSFIRWIMDAT
jgi:hypothetical protein